MLLQVGTRLEYANSIPLSALPWPQAVHVLRRALPSRSLRATRRKSNNDSSSTANDYSSSSSGISKESSSDLTSSSAPTPALISAKSKLDRGVITQAEYEAIAKSHSALEMAQGGGSSTSPGPRENSTSSSTSSDSSGTISDATNTSNSDGVSAGSIDNVNNSNTTAAAAAANTKAQAPWSLVLAFTAPGAVVLRVHDLEAWQRGVRLGPGFGGFGVTV